MFELMVLHVVSRYIKIKKYRNKTNLFHFTRKSSNLYHIKKKHKAKAPIWQYFTFRPNANRELY